MKNFALLSVTCSILFLAQPSRGATYTSCFPWNGRTTPDAFTLCFLAGLGVVQTSVRYVDSITITPDNYVSLTFSSEDHKHQPLFSWCKSDFAAVLPNPIPDDRTRAQMQLAMSALLAQNPIKLSLLAGSDNCVSTRAIVETFTLYAD